MPRKWEWDCEAFKEMGVEVEVVLRKERSEAFDDEGVIFAEVVKVEMALREEEEEAEEAMESGRV